MFGGHDIQALSQPLAIFSGQPQHRPIAAPDHPLRTEEIENRFRVGPNGLRLLVACFGQQSRKLAMDIPNFGKRLHAAIPTDEAAFRDRRLGPMVDHDRQIRMAAGESKQRLQMTRQDECVEDQMAFAHRRDRGIQSGIVDPPVVGNILQHRAETLELRVLSQIGDIGRGVRRLHVSPADHPEDERRLIRKAKHEGGVCLVFHRLHQHGAVLVRGGS